MASLSRLIPAPIGGELTSEIQSLAVKAFRATGASGIARVDFMVGQKTKKVYLTEINTLPGSLAFYLWEKSGYPFPKMLDRLIQLGLERYGARKTINFSYDSKLLETLGKGTKS
jgi:D-alanine-D-alanine ligase